MVIIVILTIFLPILMFYLGFKRNVFTTIFNTLAVISTIIFGIISAMSIRQVLIDNTVFMTAIHGVLLNIFFLIAGGYLGIFAIYRLLILTFKELNEILS